MNPALTEMVGSTVGALTGASLPSLTRPEDQPEVHAKLRELAAGTGGQVEFEKPLLHPNGHEVWALIRAAAVRDGATRPSLAVTQIMDITDRRRSESQLRHLADHDALTGLFNRRRFERELERALRDGKRFRDSGAVLFLDLDGFKSVNDTHGHAAGDELIVRVAELLTSALRETDTLARIGGDEFAILLPRCDQAAAVLVAEKLLTIMRGAFLLNGGEQHIHISGSIGITQFTESRESSPEDLIVEADSAMYRAKQAGKDHFALYDRVGGRAARQQGR